MKNILVTGGAGFIASHMARRLAENQDHSIVIVDNFLTGAKHKIPTGKNISFIEANVNNRDEMVPLFKKYKFDYVFHYAAVVGVLRTQAHPLLVLEDVKGFDNILSLSLEHGTKRVYFSSSSEVYGESISYPQHEVDTPLNARVPYAIVKGVGESFCRSYYQEHGLEYTIFRFFNTYGPGQSEDFVMSKFIAAALKNEDITIYGDGTQTRTFCFVDDNIDACHKAFVADLLVNDVANIGNDLEIDMNRLAETIIRVTKSKSKVVYLPPLKEGDMPRRKPDITKMRVLLGHDLTPLETGITKLVEFYRS